jgi:putative acetyltransferase
MIRKYQAEDLEGVIAAWYQASLVAHSFLYEAFFELERQNIREVYMPRADTWVYTDQGRVVGFISVFDNEVGGIFIHPDWQKKGIGRSLMDTVSQDHDVLELEVFASNSNARAFYERYGFVAIQEFDDEQTGFPVVRMRYEKKASAA